MDAADLIAFRPPDASTEHRARKPSHAQNSKRFVSAETAGTGICQSSCRLHSISRCAIGGPGHGVAAASFMGERVGDPMAFVTGVGTLGVEPDRAYWMPVARAS